MAHFLQVVTTFPSVLYTVLLGVVLAYWVFVVVGAVGVDLLGDGDLGADAHGHTGIDHADLGDVGHHGHEGADGLDGHEGAFSGMLAALRLRTVPVTVALSAIILFAWLFCVLAMQAATTALAEGSWLRVAEIGAILLSPLLALPFASLAVRPLAPLFAAPAGAQPSQALIGKMCVVRTGTVTERFGEATVAGDGAELVVRVRVAAGEKLGRGEEAVIVGYDEASHEFTVAPLKGVLSDRDDA